MTDKLPLSRRDFLSLFGGMMALPYAAPSLAADHSAQDYKALVYIFLDGGNDSHNMLLPIDQARHQAYAKFRPSLSVASNSLGEPSSIIERADQNAYFAKHDAHRAYRSGYYPIESGGLGVNALMPELAELMAGNRVKAVLNAGALIQPVAKADVRQTGNAPTFLFSHKHQRQVLQTANAIDWSATGWGGALVDQLKLASPADQTLASGISYGGKSFWLQGRSSRGLQLNPKHMPKLRGMGPVTSRDQALIRSLNQQEFDNEWSAYLGEFQNRALDQMESLRQVWNAHPVSYQSTTRYDGQLFSYPDQALLGLSQNLPGTLLPQLEAVAKMMKLNATKAFGAQSQPRQLFFVRLSGFDTHAKQLDKHPQLLREVSLALESFDKAITELGLEKHVRTCVTSEFNRTLTSNGDGTDHAWGGHSLVMGNFQKNTPAAIGEFCDFDVGGNQDYDRKGRFIPTLSQDQISASLAYWYGVPSSSLSDLFVHLPNFKSTQAIESALFPELIL